MRLQATEVLSTVPNVRPSSLINLACLKHGATSSYSSAWRALQCHRQDINKADVISFGQIPYFLHGIEIANSGSTTYVTATSEGIFDNGFLCLGPMRNAFNQCRPMLIVDACHIKSKYGGVIMAASAHDVETIPEIKQPKVVIVHDREKGLQQAQRQILSFPFESICVWYLEKNVNTIFKSKFGGQIWAAAKAGSQVKHDEAMLVSYTAVNKNMRNADTVLSPRSFRTLNQNRDNGRRHQMVRTGDHLFKVTSLTSGGYTRMLCNLRMSSGRQGVREKVRLRSRGEVDDNDRYACKGCGLLGHNVQTCSCRQPPSVLPVDLEEGNQEPFQQLDIGNLNGGSGPKRTRVQNVVCINCGGNYYRKTPC
ncbi:hypothetical protein BASA60_002510 [Batrachochytrium salamandrivorans]|nr:hypothetical protein BASA60_002510 [Batrachochytrium salamandrivorans]